MNITSFHFSASVISPRSAGYEASAKPSAIERYRERVIEQRPDLFVFCYGLNDMRAGTPLELFREEMSRIIVDVKAAFDAAALRAAGFRVWRL